MKKSRHLSVAVALALLLAANVASADEPAEVHKPAPVAALGTALLNVVFVPVRLAVTVVFAELGGFTGLMTGGDHQAAKDVWNLVGGRNFLTPAFIEGEEPMHLDSYYQPPHAPRRGSYGFPFDPDIP